MYKNDRAKYNDFCNFNAQKLKHNQQKCTYLLNNGLTHLIYLADFNVENDLMREAT